MARFGRLPVELPEGVKAEMDSGGVKISGPKGTLTFLLPKRVTVKIEGSVLTVEKKGDSKIARALQGTTRANLRNMVKGVTEGWSKTLEIEGAGYRAELKGKDLSLAIGYSHPVVIKAPEGIGFKIEKNVITVEGADKAMVGQVAADVRESRRPDPYKAKGIRYQYEVIRRKPGKAAAKTEGA
ncbi:MAG: 50S ribosomal protein L6 [Candidatus Woesebacteria bacterium GW2011_GWC1_43_10b]|uniref:Large ribosomal subunit protein uL6 n=2 Tax=Candidatus Woeseibacteriota TaxID=1752722 RepID=A0A0G1GIY2_9BACT|nr:MAG: 50S ribosomal protein L6 [Candidatus Woesebacteria bacterium GW2011_GWC1_43_10b]KKT34298.1 MAG: 50S ribosomal protein L6 [Candidatus Woesebacteria bacterium GW2011_GWB1_44_11b]